MHEWGKLESATQFLPGLNLESWGVVLSFLDDMLGLLSIAREHKPNNPRPFEILEKQAANPMDLAPGFAIFQHPITMEQSMFGW